MVWCANTELTALDRTLSGSRSSVPEDSVVDAVANANTGAGAGANAGCCVGNS